MAHRCSYRNTDGPSVLSRHRRPHVRDHETTSQDSAELPRGELLVAEADPLTLLELLNEDLFTGGLTDTGFRSERKSPRT